MKARIGKKGFTLVELMIVVVILGVLAAIAIPLYMKFVQAAKSGEARLNLGKIGSLLEAYFNNRRETGTTSGVTTGTLTAMFASFPRCGPEAAPADCAACTAPNGNTEAVPAAMVMVAGTKFTPSQADWMGTVALPKAWSRIPFAITQPIQYLYCYQGTGTGAASLFTTAVFGDLDNDATMYSQFRRQGRVVDGAPTIGPIAVLNEFD